MKGSGMLGRSVDPGWCASVPIGERHNANASVFTLVIIGWGTKPPKPGAERGVVKGTPDLRTCSCCSSLVVLLSRG